MSDKVNTINMDNVDYKAVEFNEVKLSENDYVDGNGNRWCAVKLIQSVKEQGLVPFKLPLQCIDISVSVWGDCSSIYSMANHVRRALDGDSTYPVIMDHTGFIIDGWHRVLRALIEGKEYIMAVRFNKSSPAPTSYSTEKK